MVLEFRGVNPLINDITWEVLIQDYIVNLRITVSLSRISLVCWKN